MVKHTAFGGRVNFISEERSMTYKKYVDASTGIEKFIITQKQLQRFQPGWKAGRCGA